jgi:hypothetical protein
MAEKLPLNELALMLTGADGELEAVAGADDAAADDAGVDGDELGAPLPDELLPQAAAASPRPAIAATYARFLVKSKVSSRGGAGPAAREYPRRPGTAFVRSAGRYGGTP